MKKKRSNSFKITFLMLWPIALFIVGVEVCRTPPGFSIEKIRSNFAFQETENDKVLSQPEDFKNVKQALSQEFQYLGSGDQCYVFISQDQEYVIKFFKMRQLTPKYWLNYLPFPWLEKYRLEKIDRRERQRKETFDSFRIAFNELKGQTGLLFVHFYKTHYAQDKVTVVDKKGKKHQIPLNTVPFVLQRKAQMIFPYVTDLMQNGDKEEALSALISVLQLVKQRCQKGLADKDDGVRSNYGFIEGHPVDIDTGQIVRENHMKEPMNYLRELLRVSKKIDVWLQENYPELCPLFQEEVHRMLSNEELSSS